MINKNKIKAIAFDFGGTLDSPFLHWMDLYIHVYNAELNLHLTKENFRDSYIHAEQMMERLHPVKPEHTLLDTQIFKATFQFGDLIRRGVLSDTVENREQIPLVAARLVAYYASTHVLAARDTLARLHDAYTLLLVSNYYGNLRHIVADLGIVSYFHSVTDSTLEGIRKPDPALWKLAISRAGFSCDEVLVVGDSMKNDILPALSLGCQVIQGCPVKPAEETEHTVITRLQELETLLLPPVCDKSVVSPLSSFGGGMTSRE